MVFKMVKRGFVLCGVLGLALSLAQIPIPEYPGDPDSGAHKGQPLWCQNYDTKLGAHNCECHYMNPTDKQCERHPNEPELDEPTGPDTSKCKVYCRKTECRCKNHCES